MILVQKCTFLLFCANLDCSGGTFFSGRKKMSDEAFISLAVTFGEHPLRTQFVLCWKVADISTNACLVAEFIQVVIYFFMFCPPSPASRDAFLDIFLFIATKFKCFGVADRPISLQKLNKKTPIKEDVHKGLSFGVL